MDPTQQPGITFAQIFLERAQFSHRDDVLLLPATTPFQPTLAVRFEGGVAPDEKSGFVRITVQTSEKDRPLYNIDLSMIALFQREEKRENLPLKDYVRGAAPVMLYPFVREAVAGLTWRGRFGPVWLAPFNVGATLSTSAEWTSVPEQVLPKIVRPSRAAKKRQKVRSGSRG